MRVLRVSVELSGAGLRQGVYDSHLRLRWYLSRENDASPWLTDAVRSDSCPRSTSRWKASPEQCSGDGDIDADAAWREVARCSAEWQCAHAQVQIVDVGENL